MICPICREEAPHIVGVQFGKMVRLMCKACKRRLRPKHHCGGINKIGRTRMTCQRCGAWEELRPAEEKAKGERRNRNEEAA